MSDYPPEWCEPLKEIADILREKSPSEVAIAQTQKIANRFAGQRINITKKSSLVVENRQIRSEYLRGDPIKQIAKRHNIHPATVHRIIKR